MTPRSISKSLVKALGCETHFAATYLDPNSTRDLVESSESAQTGTNFHEYRQRYVDHLVAANQCSDQLWAYEWMARKNPDEDARELIDSDIGRFTIDPQAVFGTEVLLSVDEQFLPLECEPDSLRNRRSRPSFAKAIIDHLELSGDEAIATDIKSTWTAKTDEYEADHIAAMVFAHFQVQRVTFQWEFIRLRGLKEVRRYEREELPLLQVKIRRKAQEYGALLARVQAGEQVSVNPWAGVCMFCNATCPLRPAVESGTLEIPPIQNVDDARQLAARLYVGQIFNEQAQGLLREYVERTGPLDLGNGYELGIKVSEKKAYPLKDALGVLGISVSSETGHFDVPLRSLTVSGISSLAKAKKRQGLTEALLPIAKISTSASLEFRRLPLNLADQLEESLRRVQVMRAIEG